MHNDARKSFRIQTPEHQQRGVFVLGRRRFQVLMLNASADGFAFLSPQPIQIKTGAVACLQADDAWYKVVVIRSDETDEGVVYGVERLADIASEADDSAPAWGRSRGSDGRASVATLLAVAGVILCAALSAYLIAGRPTLDALLRTVTAETSAGQTPPALTEEIASAPVIIGEHLAVTAIAPKASRLTGGRNDEAEIASRQRMLLDEETAKRLQLTSHQQRELQKLLGRSESSSSAESGWEALRQDEARILQLLSPTQVSQWRNEAR